MCHRLRSASVSPAATRSPGWSRPACSSILSSTASTHRRLGAATPSTRGWNPRQAGCMVKSDTQKKAPRLPAQIDRAIAAAEDKKAVDLVVLDLRKAAGFTDFFVIASGTNPRQVRAIADSVMEALAADGVKPAHVEGYARSKWILIDYFDFIVHVFAPETRTFYSLERLWGNAERIEVAAGR